MMKSNRLNPPYLYSSLTRISDLPVQPFDVMSLPRNQWETSDYVVGEVVSPVPVNAQLELPNGRLASLLEGDRIIGAFGIRRATLEAVGEWQSIGDDGRMDNMTCAGLFGKVTSKSYLLPPLTSLQYRGHVLRNGQKVSMKDFVSTISYHHYDCPTIMIIGTSMSAGKTTSARIIIHQLKQLGLKVIGAKLTGAGRYRDVLSMKDAGADYIFDFVDVGLPSSVAPPEEFRVLVRQLLSMMAAKNPDVVVIEAGASPLEPYNGSVVLEELKKHICLTVLCASDPYSVVGVCQGFGFLPDLITGIATSTSSGVELVKKLTGIQALTLSEPSALPLLTQLLENKLHLAPTHVLQV
ncbi:AAA family ATPase [Cyanothece sp. BG0011]|uniref:AAA family ATPase n=1 Tax=Cyanothece sp. BG0011 TaxID=2082950 RepID=UPI000D1D83C8|nr:AAA family ATPase [Cyanothece sp. BG0011]